MISFISLSINTKHRIIALNNVVLLFEFQLMSMGFNTQGANTHAMCYICFQTFKTFFTDYLLVNES